MQLKRLIKIFIAKIRRNYYVIYNAIVHLNAIYAIDLYDNENRIILIGTTKNIDSIKDKKQNIGFDRVFYYE